MREASSHRQWSIINGAVRHGRRCHKSITSPLRSRRTSDPRGFDVEVRRTYAEPFRNNISGADHHHLSP
ncbi:hypothetical protein Bca4012_036476 [Brassica carinata]|uniref:Uncharacterized protein n=1 Tax=Brassica carinata TaxID=52824 RepID=A0A8X8B9W7_BRACI|nr:hypothetical protein Bca52824_010188 [Brassica carinata]